MMKKLIWAMAISVMLVSCADEDPEQEAVYQPSGQSEEYLAPDEEEVDESQAIKVFVNRNQEVLANGEVVSLDELDKRFAETKRKHGPVYYSRADASTEPPQVAIDVMNLVVKHRLPIKFYTDATFTTLMDMEPEEPEADE